LAFKIIAILHNTLLATRHHPGHWSQMGGNINILDEKLHFLGSRIFTFLAQTERKLQRGGNPRTCDRGSAIDS
jgi:hypothetical protein